jgi:hypothetical protein
MAGVGLSTDLRRFGKLGWRPLYLGAISSALVAALALALAAFVGPPPVSELSRERERVGGRSCGSAHSESGRRRVRRFDQARRGTLYRNSFWHSRRRKPPMTGTR